MVFAEEGHRSKIGATGHDFTGWYNIVAVSANDHHTVGLRADGTVVATGADIGDMLNVGDWRDIKVP